MNISLYSIKKYYGDKVALDIDNLSIRQGIITGIIGPNGSGKSTLLRILSGLDKEFSGDIKYNGDILCSDIYNKMTLVTQKPYLFKRSVYENIVYPLKVRKINKDRIKALADDTLKSLDINDLRSKKAHLLSGGESQKVSLARALIFEPQLLFLDEPTSNIDPESIKTMEREIIKFNKEKKSTVVIVTHNLEQAKRLCDEIIYMENGKVGTNNGLF
ncbi:ABC transporter ATP-binding protein [Brassicibacter mesophilus]|uniref:ABC transporter ATP-binding protein n=1 Tax=Brassicibacter mesophilus TaxID=745119 RepID=UPI003D21BC9F